MWNDDCVAIEFFGVFHFCAEHSVNKFFVEANTAVSVVK